MTSIIKINFELSRPPSISSHQQALALRLAPHMGTLQFERKTFDAIENIVFAFQVQDWSFEMLPCSISKSGRA